MEVEGELEGDGGGRGRGCPRMENGECVCVQLKRLSSWPHKGRNSEEDLVIEIQKNSQRL